MFETALTGTVDAKTLNRRVPDLRVGLVNAQYDLARADFSTVIVLAGDDRLGCEGVLNRMHEWMDARHLDTAVFDSVTESQRLRPFLWRYWQMLPAHGRIGIMSGSLVGHGLVAWARKDDENNDPRFARHQRAFEELLAQDGTLLIKFWLHLTPEEHRRRFERQDEDTMSAWSIPWMDEKLADEADEWQPRAEEWLRATDHAAGRWHVIDANDRRFRDLTVAETVLEQLTTRLETPFQPGPGAFTSSPRPDVLASLDLEKRVEHQTYRARLDKQQSRLRKWIERANEAGVTTVLAFEGWDAAGKGGVIRRITNAMPARYYRVVSVAAPTDEEKAHHYLWRFWRQLPRDGRMIIFDRSWYGRVLVERVEGFATRAEWSRAYQEINNFETELTDHGIVVRKFWLHISPEEQLRRFEAREQTAYKKYKITDEDYRNRGQRDAYLEAINDMVALTNTTVAPWHMIPAEDKRVARVEVLNVVADALRNALRGRDDD